MPSSLKTLTCVARLRIARAAQQDLRDIRIYSKLAFGAPVARDYLEGLRKVFRLLREQPFAGAAEDDLGVGIRGFAYRAHRIYYQVDGGGDEVLIVRILHHARHAAAAFGGDQ